MAFNGYSDYCRALSKFGKVGVVGYCFGGLLTWLSSCSVSGLSAASCYYGGGIADNLDKDNKCSC